MKLGYDVQIEQFLKVEETQLKDTWYVELPNGYKGYVPTKLLSTILKTLSKEVKIGGN